MKFLKNEINIGDIVKTVETALSKAPNIENPSLDDIFNADIETRKFARNF